MITANTDYKRILNDFMGRIHMQSENAIFFFQGFPLAFYTAVSALHYSHFSGSWSGLYPDIEQQHGKKLLPGFLSCSGICWGFYEELIALANVINDFSIYDGKIVIVKNNQYTDYYPVPVHTDIADVIHAFENELPNHDEKKLQTYYSDFKIIDNELWLSYVNKHFDIDIGSPAEEYGIYAVGEKPSLLADTARGISDSEEKTRYLPLLKKYWGEDADFRINHFYQNPAVSAETIGISQGTIISDIITQCGQALSRSNDKYSDLIVTAPTGAGKSVFFQIPGIYLHESQKALTIVICPLVALMVDQVRELHERGIAYATYINSTLTYEQREERLDGIKAGIYSIVYLSPELLLAYDSTFLFGDRAVGLMVIDEAHLVTSWGRDFRVDYWFLGDHIEKMRRGSYYGKNKPIDFPVLCLTATAVYGGRDDVIGDLLNSLHLKSYSEHQYIGYVRKDNLHFKINRHSKTAGSNKDEKITLTTNAICDFVANGEKSIVYFPFKSQIEDVYNKINADHSDISGRVEKYYSGGMDSLERDAAYTSFRDSDSLAMMATKAFGMGVNISDILNVYHYAPTGTLADYVQEIGRAARKLEKGYAITDYLPSDMQYARMLWGLSGLRHYQIKEIMKKLYELYQTKKSRNLLFSPETFNYLFDENTVDAKVKSGLMLLSADLLEKYHFKVITIRAKNLLSKQYIIVPFEIEKEFLTQYGRYCVLMDDSKPQVERAYGYKPETVITKLGNVFEIDLSALWEDEFDDSTFAQFKHHFFNGDLFSFGTDKVVPNMKLVMTYERGYDNISEAFARFASALQKTFLDLKRQFGGRIFSFTDFHSILTHRYEEKIRREYAMMLLDLFCYDHVDLYNIPSESWKFIERRKSDASGSELERQYCIRTQKYAHIESTLKRYLIQAAPNSVNDQYIAYLSINNRSGGKTYQQLLSSLLQLMGFASHELIGGRNPQIFVRINDPIKLKRLADSSKPYRNAILSAIDERHARAVAIMNGFMGVGRDDEECWQIIEDYFLGHDDMVDAKLGISQDGALRKKKC